MPFDPRERPWHKAAVKTGEMFGLERVHNLVRRYAHLSAQEISSKITEDATRFRGKERPEDDLTFVVVKIEN